MSSNSIEMIWGFSGKPASREHVLGCVGAGWHKLVHRLIDDLFSLGWDGQVYQVKEKFGGLRFYIGKGTDDIHTRIAQAEAESYKTCEVCGEPGTERSPFGWIKILCDEHAK